MTNRIMLHAHANENTIQFRTVGIRMKSPQSFYVTYSELDRLRRDGSIIANDIHSYVQLQLDARRDRLTFDFTWLTGRSFGRVDGIEQTIYLCWSAFRGFLENCRQPDGPKDFKALSLDVSKRRPRLVFDGNTVNPLYNDFLLWQEDWSGSGVSYNNTDPACSNVGAIYKGNISIAAGTTATKTAFTLPAIDNYWFSFNARGDSLEPAETAAFDVVMTVDGVEKTVMSSVMLRGVQGTETLKVTGDGWQCFAFPVAQYFADYKGKSCEVKIIVKSGDAGIRLDQVAFKERSVDPAIDMSKVDVYNNTFDETTEDWMLGEQYKTSQYYWWDVIDRKTLKREGYIQIDCSDGGGDEKRNGNTNAWMAKHYVLPESDNISLKFNVTSDNPTGAYVKISLYVEGKYFVLYDWQSADPSFNRSNIEISLKSLDSTLDFSGKETTVVFEARDGGCNNGVGEACQFMDFITVA